jgi:hypothetical protein
MSSDAWRRWTPRVLGVLLCLFAALFALDAASPLEMLIHLIPAAALLAILAVAWRWPGAGGAAFIGVAAAYALAAWRHPSWVAVIGGALLAVGVLFVSSGRPPRPTTMED